MRNVKLWEFREGQLCIPTKTIAFSLCLKIETLSPLKQKWTSQLVSRPKKKKKQTYQSTESEMFLRGDEGQGEVPGSVWGKENWRLNIPGLPSQWISSWVVSYLRGFLGTDRHTPQPLQVGDKITPAWFKYCCLGEKHADSPRWCLRTPWVLQHLPEGGGEGETYWATAPTWTKLCSALEACGGLQSTSSFDLQLHSEVRRGTERHAALRVMDDLHSLCGQKGRKGLASSR